MDNGSALHACGYWIMAVVLMVESVFYRDAVRAKSVSDPASTLFLTHRSSFGLRGVPVGLLVRVVVVVECDVSRIRVPGGNPEDPALSLC